ncbi:MAG: hypothetical protein A2Y33_04315 [Spirochaetes bacterium GWF1_51_8]|nr:MAG: hypothetical protein A2Y33_04315 [Spirochaetes bacterium GWF1_51_8]
MERTLQICRDRDLDGARALQTELQTYLNDKPIEKPIRMVAGIDTAYSATRAYSAIVVFDIDKGRIAAEYGASEEIIFPYIPGFLSFREFPAIYRAYLKMNEIPDILLFDGHGIAHPRGMGIAAQGGILLDMPSVGCGKSKLCGVYSIPGGKRFDYSELTMNDKVIGLVMRTREKAKPVFLSPGYRFAIDSIPALTGQITGAYRLPLPVHYADRLSKKLKPDA